jgi:hypothetical protein
MQSGAKIGRSVGQSVSQVGQQRPTRHGITTLGCPAMFLIGDFLTRHNGGQQTGHVGIRDYYVGITGIWGFHTYE